MSHNIQILNEWDEIELLNSTYLKGRIGWQGLRAEEFMTEGPHLVTGTDFNNGKINWDKCYRISEQRFNEAPSIHLRDEDVVITKDGTIGKVAIIEDCPERAILNSGIFVLRCKDSSYTNKYLYYILTSEIFKKWLRTYQGGSTIVHLYQREFERFKFNAPSINLQRKIAEILTTVDEQIEATEQLIKKYEMVKEGMMQDLFTRGIDTATGKLRPKQKDAPHLYKKSELGWIPKEWQTEAIAKDFRVKYGISIPLDRNIKNGIPIISLPNVSKEGKLNIEETPFVDEQCVRDEDYLKKNDILFNWRNGSIDHLGKSVLWDKIGQYTHVGFLLNIRKKNASVDAKYFSFYLKRIKQNGFFKLAKAQINNTFNSNELNDTIYLKPQIEEQRIISNKLNQIFEIMSNLDREILNINKVKQGLMQDLLTGKKEVKI